MHIPTPIIPMLNLRTTLLDSPSKGVVLGVGAALVLNVQAVGACIVWAEDSEYGSLIATIFSIGVCHRERERGRERERYTHTHIYMYIYIYVYIYIYRRGREGGEGGREG